MLAVQPRYVYFFSLLKELIQVGLKYITLQFNGLLREVFLFPSYTMNHTTPNAHSG